MKAIRDTATIRTGNFSDRARGEGEGNGDELLPAQAFGFFVVHPPRQDKIIDLTGTFQINFIMNGITPTISNACAAAMVCSMSPRAGYSHEKWTCCQW